MRISKIDDLPEAVKTKIGNGADIFLKAYNDALDGGAEEYLCFARAWSAIEKAGFSEDENGVWRPTSEQQEESMFKRFVAWLKKASGARTLYVRRNVANAEEIVQWAKDNGFAETLQPDDLHVTICFSKKMFHCQNLYPSMNNLVIKGGNRKIEKLGDKGAVVLKIESVDLTDEWSFFRRNGASWDYEAYEPHITISYKGGPVDIEPFSGDIILGPQIFEDVVEDWDEKIVEKEYNSFSIEAKITKIDEEHRLIYGWASIIEEYGKVVVDKQGDVIDVADLVAAAHDYMTESREAHEMHEGVKKGETVESIIFTKEVQAALGIDLKKVGWFICQKISDDDTWAAIKSGEIKSFSIGGSGKRVPIE